MSKLLLFAAFVASSYAAPFVNSVRPRGVGDPVTSLPPKLDYTQYPEIDQAIFITGKYLTAPIVQDAMAIVKKVVPQELLNIPVSTYILYGDVTYHSDPDKYCYWPNSLCVRKTGGNGYIADAYTCSGTKRWGLTYDDGPTSNIVNGIHVSDTSEIRSNLKSLGVKATFFMTGTNIRINPDEAKKNVDEGHQIALHTWTHHPLTTCTNEQIVAEIKYTEAALYEATGKITTYLRPPYGDVDDRVRAIANALGYRIALWDRESTDTATDDADSVLNVIKGWFDRPESFVSLEHDITPFTSSIAVRALKAIADYKNSHGGVFPLQISDMASCNGHQPYAYDSSKLKDWDFCTASSQCATNCCSKEYSGDGQYKCTPGGSVCVSSIPSPSPATSPKVSPSPATSPVVTSPKTSPAVSPTPAKLGDWAFCTGNSQCTNNCCSNQYSNDGQYKCTPGGSVCLASVPSPSPATSPKVSPSPATSPVASPVVTSPKTSPVVSPTPAKLGDWAFCTGNSQCTNNCCSNQYSNDGQYKCTPGGSVCLASVPSPSPATSPKVSPSPATSPKVSPVETSPKTSPLIVVSPTPVKLGDWAFCTGNSQCTNNCCSNQYSGDGKYKCTPGGTVCLAAIPSPGASPVVTSPAKLGDWTVCTRSSQCANNCCSSQYSAGIFKCTPGGGVCV